MVRVIEYHFISSHELFERVIRNNVEVWIPHKGIKISTNSSLFCNFQSQSKRLHYNNAKCLVFLRFSQQTLVFVSKVPKTLYQPLVRPHFHKTPCQVLISSFYPHHTLLVFWELILGYVIPLDWYPYFLMVKLYSKYLSILSPHSLDHDLNLETLEGKCNQR